jgi:hypothetical protein
MMSTVKSTTSRRSPSRLARLAALLLGFAAASVPALAGQASAFFRVTVDLRPPTQSCTAGIGAKGQARIDCSPAVIGGGGAGGSGDSQGYRLPDARVKLRDALVAGDEASYFAWGEYSSRFVVAGRIEYVEMTVTW